MLKWNCENAQDGFVMVHKQSRRKVAICHQFDVEFRLFESASVDSPAASNRKLQELSGDAPSATLADCAIRSGLAQEKNRTSWASLAAPSGHVLLMQFNSTGDGPFEQGSSHFDCAIGKRRAGRCGVEIHLIRHEECAFDARNCVLDWCSLVLRSNSPRRVRNAP